MMIMNISKNVLVTGHTDLMNSLSTLIITVKNNFSLIRHQPRTNNYSKNQPKANSADPDQMAPKAASLIWGHAHNLPSPPQNYIAKSAYHIYPKYLDMSAHLSSLPSLSYNFANFLSIFFLASSTDLKSGNGQKIIYHIH